MIKKDVRIYIDNAIQSYGIPANQYNSVLDAITDLAWPEVDTFEDLVKLDIDTLFDGIDCD